MFLCLGWKSDQTTKHHNLINNGPIVVTKRGFKSWEAAKEDGNTHTGGNAIGGDRISHRNGVTI